ncbi:hypothetical protein CI088_13835 [Enterococcus plantarum]|uniref:Phage protein n=1 Tax=Enterococcus plantarum TaxID=1077675 RepID=A0A2W3YSU2_9ENTE|nr:hypothetical protein [Enterococcus plantarum]PZL70958.1 hypothetical protein CI088_13835 [Enterococcus plantarum]
MQIEDFNEIARLTIPDYELRMKAYQLKQLDRQYEIHLQAWATVMAGQTRKGKPIFRTFDKFFDYRKAEEKILGRQKRTTLDKEKLQNWIANFNS